MHPAFLTHVSVRLILSLCLHTNVAVPSSQNSPRALNSVFTNAAAKPTSDLDLEHNRADGGEDERTLANMFSWNGFQKFPLVFRIQSSRCQHPSGDLQNGTIFAETSLVSFLSKSTLDTGQNAIKKMIIIRNNNTDQLYNVVNAYIQKAVLGQECSCGFCPLGGAVKLLILMANSKLALNKNIK